MTPPVLRLHACAKLNLVLRITGKRADGYHLLETLYVPIELGDDLTATVGGDGVQLTVTTETARGAVGAGPDNLVVRAATGFLQRLQQLGRAAPRGLRFHLHKRVPAGAGLGGGSSDAAAALRLCQALTGTPLCPADLVAIARALGADVPFFLAAGPQWGRGIGDELTPAPPLPPLELLLLLPAFGCPTVDVYKTYARQLIAAGSIDSLRRNSRQGREDPAAGIELMNDLEAAAEVVRPELRALRAAVTELGFPQVRMTGSGSTMFLCFRTADERSAARHRLEPVLAGLDTRCVPSRSANTQLEPPAAAVWPSGGG